MCEFFDLKRSYMPEEKVPASENQSKPEDAVKPAAKPAVVATSGGKSPTKLIAIVVVALVLLAIVGYALNAYVWNKAGEKVAEGILESATGGQVDVDSSGDEVTVTGDDGSWSASSKNEWPSDMPSVVPEFKYGDIEASSKVTVDTTGWTVSYSNLQSGATAKYKTDLTSKGWTISSEMTSGDAETIMAEADGYTLIYVADLAEDTAGLTVSEATTQ